jgi:hypothetical protein
MIASGHCCNEIAILLPYIVFEQEQIDANEFESAFILCRRFIIDRILISKIVEYGDMCSRFFDDNQDSADTTLADMAKAYEPIEAQLKSAKWARILRNKISFRYDQTHALSALTELHDDHPLRLLAGRLKGLTLFEFAEEIVSRPIFESAGKGDIGKGMDVTNSFIIKLVSAITTFHAKATISLFKKHGMISERIQTEIREKYCARPGTVRIPLSVSVTSKSK